MNVLRSALHKGTLVICKLIMQWLELDSGSAPSALSSTHVSKRAHKVFLALELLVGQACQASVPGKMLAECWLTKRLRLPQEVFSADETSGRPLARGLRSP